LANCIEKILKVIVIGASTDRMKEKKDLFLNNSIKLAMQRKLYFHLTQDPLPHLKFIKMQHYVKTDQHIVISCEAGARGGG